MIKKSILLSVSVLGLTSTSITAEANPLLEDGAQETRSIKKVDFWADKDAKGIMSMLDSMLQINPAVLARLQKTGLLIKKKRDEIGAKTRSPQEEVQKACSDVLAPVKQFFEDITAYKAALRPMIELSIVKNGNFDPKKSLLMKYVASKDSLPKFCEKNVTDREIFIQNCDELERLFEDISSNLSDQTREVYKAWAKEQATKRSLKKK